MRKALLAVAMLGAIPFTGCKKQVPTDIVQKSLKNALMHAPMIASAVCGTSASGLGSLTVSNVVRKEDNTGTAHISGSPFAKSTPKCDGDVQFRYSYTTRTSGTRKRRTTTTTWILQHLTLTAIQTPGVANKTVDEDPDDDDDDTPGGASSAPAKK